MVISTVHASGKVIGDRRKPSPLGDIQPEHWPSEYTSIDALVARLLP